MTFLQRKINVQITLSPEASEVGQARTFAGGTDTVVLSGLRMSCKINNAGGLSNSTMDLSIWGLTKSMMDQLATLGIQLNLAPKNRIVVTAGDDTNGMGTVFDGFIVTAYSDYQGAPDVPFVITAHVQFVYQMIPAVVTSFPGPVDVATAMSGFANLMRLKFENNGVKTKLPPSYFSGSIMDQAQAVVTAAGIEWNRGINGVLAIWPKNCSRDTPQVPLVSPETGMVGYPTYTKFGIMVKTLFNPSIGFGNLIQVKSSLDAASGSFKVYSLDHVLETQVPNGQWFTMVGASNPKHPTPPPGAR